VPVPVPVPVPEPEPTADEDASPVSVFISESPWGSSAIPVELSYSS